MAYHQYETGPGFTGRYVAGLRFIESTRVNEPLLVDPLAGRLAGERGLQLAEQELHQLQEAQGPGRHLRVPARTRLIDDLLQREITQLCRDRDGADTPSTSASPSSSSSSDIVCQVVALGAGMCTRAWRLAALSRCQLLELDLPHMAELKRTLLAEAGAQMDRADTAAAAAATTADADAADAGETGFEFPLLAASYACVGADLSTVGEPSTSTSTSSQASPEASSKTSTAATGAAAASAAAAIAGAVSTTAVAAALSAALVPHGFDPCLPIIWVAEALLYYMPCGAAARLLAAAAALSAAGSRLVATVVDRELLEASRSRVHQGHVFKDLWFFDAEELLYGTEAFQPPAWRVDWAASALEQHGEGQQQKQEGGDKEEEEGQQRKRLPPSSRQLAAARLGAETYVALYGGSELVFVAGLQE